MIELKGHICHKCARLEICECENSKKENGISIPGYGDRWMCTYLEVRHDNPIERIGLQRIKQNPMPQLELGMFLISKNSWSSVQSSQKFLKDYIIDNDEIEYHEGITCGIPISYAENNKEDIIYIYKDGKLIWEKK